MILSQTGEYALRATLYLAEYGADRAVQVGEMARALSLPQNYLSKTLHQLARAGVLASTRGKAGGFRLAVPPDRLTLHRVLAPFGDIEERRRCLLGRTQCSDRYGCAVHTRWKDVAERMSTFFRETTVADLVRGAALPV
jgi:Rrf2 family protein